MITEGIWPASGKKALGDQPVQLGRTWEPTPNGVFLRYHISDIWLDDAAQQRATKLQTEAHKALIRSRWMPAWVDAVEYGKFGRAKVTATLFGGMDTSLYADFKAGSSAQMNSVENTLKHTHGDYSPAHMASGGRSWKLPGFQETPPWAAVAFRFVSRRTKSSKASAPGASSGSGPQVGPWSTCLVRNTSERASRSDSQAPTSSRSTNPLPKFHGNVISSSAIWSRSDVSHTNCKWRFSSTTDF